MSSKRTLVKQRVTYGSVGDDNLLESDEDLTDKRSPTKRVSFGGGHELSDSDSDEENSQGRINRSSGAKPTGDSLDGLFRESSAKERKGSLELVKGNSEERRLSQDKYSLREDKGQPRPAPRPRPTIAARRSHFEGHSVTVSQQSSDEDGEDLSAVTWPIKAKDRHPVPPPRTSPRQHQEKSSSPDMESPRPVPRSRPALSPRERKLKLSEQDSDVHEYERTKELERDSGVREYEKTTTKPDKPVPRSRPALSSRERKQELFEQDSDVHEYERTKALQRDSGVREYEKTATKPDKPVPRSKPPLSPKERKLKLFEGDSDVHEYERTKALVRDSGVHEYEKTATKPDKPAPRSRPALSSKDRKLKLFERDSDVYEYERTKDLERDSGVREYERTETKPDKPVPRSRPALSSKDRKLKLFERDSDVYEYERTKDLERDSGVHEYERTEAKPDKPVAPLRRKKTLEETHEIQTRPQIPIVRTSTFEDDGPFLDRTDRSEIEQDGNLRRERLNKVKGRPVISVARSDSSDEESDYDTREVVRTGFFGSKRHYKEEQGRNEKDYRDPRERSVATSRPPKPSPRSGMMADHSMKNHVQSEEEGNRVKRPGSAPLKKASSLETLQSRQDSMTKKPFSGPKEQGAQRVHLKKSLTPQRPMSAKKGTFMTKLKAQSDITNTFEEHVPLSENIIETADERGLRKKSALDTGGGRSRPLKANQGISTMTQSPHPKDAHTDLWTDTKSSSHSGTPKRSLSMSNLQGTSSEIYSDSGSARGTQRDGVMDTKSIRQAVFDEWMAAKSVRLKEQRASKSTEKKKLEEKDQEEHERKKMAKRAFESWSEKKQEENKGKSAKKKELMEKELEKQKEKNLKARDAKKYFESWKSKKDEELKEEHQKKREEQRNKKKKEEEEKQEKGINAQKVFDNWKKNKDEKIKEEVRKKRKDVKEDTMKEEEKMYDRSIECAERYQAWVEKKGKPRRGPPPPTLTQRSWCPSGRTSNNCIPDKVGSVIQAPSPNRSRTMSGSYYFKTNKY